MHVKAMKNFLANHYDSKGIKLWFLLHWLSYYFDSRNIAAAIFNLRYLKYSLRQPRLRYLRQRHNVGHCFLRNQSFRIVGVRAMRLRKLCTLIESKTLISEYLFLKTKIYF